MKATGIVRRIDDLGRVVIPKEIRRTLRIREGDPLEIFTDREGEVVLKKYSPIGEIGSFAGVYAECLAQTAECLVCITDTDQIIAAAGTGKKEFQEQYITKQLGEFLVKRMTKAARSSEKEFVRITMQQSDTFVSQVISPVLCEGDVIGAVVLMTKDEDRDFGEMEKRMALCAAGFLGRQMEQ